MVRKLRWGILSTAKIGLKQVMPAIKQSKNGVLAALASRSLESAQEAAAPFGIPHVFGSYEEMLASPEVDAVYVPLPNAMHKEWTIRAANHGKHVLCEKPLALNAAEADEMITAARQNHVLLMEAFMYRFHPQFAKLKALIADGAIGDVKVMRSAFCYNIQGANNIRLDPDLGGGALMDVGCYCVNMARLVADAEPVEVRADATIGKSGVDETLVGILRFPNDVVAHFDCSFRTDYREWLDVQGTKHRVDLARPIKPGTRAADIFLRFDETSETNPNSTLITAPAANHYRLMVEHFADAALNGKPLRYPPEDARANMRVIDALYESARTGRAVKIVR
ncbi:MAG: Gfo/Idh/MocA family oxidoreductase [Chloroflexi bacterium]|nr:Gfo/Idh/MocA family oxidoreductase [Chloroflexota bacterium]